VNIEGIGGHAASLIKLIPEIATRYWFSRQQDSFKISSIESAAGYAKSLLYGKPAEHFYIACLDSSYRVKMTPPAEQGHSV
jgi:DNA repair protein RadC